MLYWFSSRSSLFYEFLNHFVVPVISMVSVGIIGIALKLKTLHTTIAFARTRAKPEVSREKCQYIS